jgi:class 3 adenylate cyclase
MAHLIALNDGTLQRDASDSFVAAFDRASDAVMCALDLQLAPLEPFALCIGVHAVEHTDSADSDGAARLRDIARGGQTLISAAAAALVSARMPAHAALTPLRDRVRHEPVYQLNHPGLRTEADEVPHLPYGRVVR